MTEEERTAQLTEGMRFERRTPTTAHEKAEYADLEASCGEAARVLQKLHLRLWHATQGDYRSLPITEARALLEEAKGKINAALDKCPPDQP
jgi:hypothetical protein